MKPTFNLGQPLRRVQFFVNYVLSSPRLLISLTFCLFWIASIIWYYSYSTHDPSSFFYSKYYGHEKIYSLIREQEAEAYISAVDTVAGDAPGLHIPSSNPLLCLGVATVARPDKQYIRATVGSILDGLTDEERAQIHFTFFIAHTNTSVHPSARESWTKSVPDTALSYDGLDEKKILQIMQWEKDHDYISKGLFDYQYLLQSCYEKTPAPYIAILEGDVLAAKGWYNRAITAAQHIDSLDPFSKDQTGGEDKINSQWLYLRLFYTEYYFAWNSEEWPTFLAYSVGMFFALGISLIVLRTCFPHYLSRTLSNPNLLLILFMFLPMTIGLYISLGRSTIAGLSHPFPAGVQQMNNYGCCGQGFVFPRRLIPMLRKRIDERVEGYIDMLMERVAAMYGLQRWAVVPSVLQHIGVKSSKGDAIADSRANMIWSYAFERWGRAGALGL